jgi:hypothetical protein
MNAVLGTLPFIATIWLLVVLGAAVLEESGAKIAAALKGKQRDQQPVGTMRMRMRVQLKQPRRAIVPLRAAA